MRLIFIIKCLIISQICIGQVSFDDLIGKTFVEQEFKFIKILDDSLLSSSLYQVLDTANYEFKPNELLINVEMYNSKSEKGYDIHIYDYEIINLTDSSFTLKTPYGKEYYFKDIKLLPNRITKFESLELKLLTPWRSNREIKIDNEGNYYDKITFIPTKSRRFKRKKKVIKEKLTKKELSDVFQKLTDYYALYLPAKRNCGIDSERSDFYMKLNGVTIKSEGCGLNWLHYDLLEYLLNLRKSSR